MTQQTAANLRRDAQRLRGVLLRGYRDPGTLERAHADLTLRIAEHLLAVTEGRAHVTPPPPPSAGRNA